MKQVKCPKCGGSDELHVRVSALMRVRTFRGEFLGFFPESAQEIEYADEAPAVCRACNTCLTTGQVIFADEPNTYRDAVAAAIAEYLPKYTGIMCHPQQNSYRVPLPGRAVTARQLYFAVTTMAADEELPAISPATDAELVAVCRPITKEPTTVGDVFDLCLAALADTAALPFGVAVYKIKRLTAAWEAIVAYGGQRLRLSVYWSD